MTPIDPMTPQQRVFALATGFFILAFILELVRRRKLKEEYSWLWLLAGSLISLVVIWYDLLGFFSILIGARVATTTLFIFSILFLIIVNLYHSLKISALSEQIKNLSQIISLMEKELKDLKKAKKKRLKAQ